MSAHAAEPQRASGLPARSAAVATAPAVAPRRRPAEGHELDAVVARRLGVQAKLEVGRSDDPLEAEADDVAQRALGEAPVTEYRTGPGSRPATRLQRAGGSSSAASAEAAGVGGALRSPGEPLPGGTRSFFEQRLGADLSAVRVHTRAEAAASADALGARAYTVGSDLVFGAGEYQPAAAAGRRLLAHELVHVLQQRRLGASVQRDDKKDAPAAAPIAFVLDDSEVTLKAAQAVSPTTVRVFDPESMCAALKRVSSPISTLFIYSHSNSLGEVQFVSSIGTVSWKKLSEIRGSIKGCVPADKAPQVVDFRGCKVGEAPQELGSFREAVGAKSAKATNCFGYDSAVGPVSVNDTAVTSQSQLDGLTDGEKALFDKGLKQLINSLKADNGTSVKNCTIGLARGETADKSFAKLKTQYFKGQGSLTAEWVSPELNSNWQSGSLCLKDVTESTKPCSITTKTAMAEPGGGGEAASEAASAEPVPAESGDQYAAAEPVFAQSEAAAA